MTEPGELPAKPADDSLESLLTDETKKEETVAPPAEADTIATPAPATELEELPAAEVAAVPAEEFGLRDAQAVSAAEVDKALHSFTEANDRMALAQAADDKAEIKKLRSGFYLSLYGLADCADVG